MHSLDFHSKRDARLAVLLWNGAAMLVAGAFRPWALYGSGHRVTAAEVAVRSGPFRWRVPLDAIESVVPSRNPRSPHAVRR
jgi:hypothetical protein